MKTKPTALVLKIMKVVMAITVPGCTNPEDSTLLPSEEQTVQQAGDDASAAEQNTLTATLIGGVNVEVSLSANPNETSRFDFFGLADLEIHFDSPNARATVWLTGVDVLMAAPFILTGDLEATDELVFDFEYEDESDFFSAGSDPLGMLTITSFLLTETHLAITGTFSVSGQSLDAAGPDHDTTVTGTFSYDGPVASL